MFFETPFTKDNLELYLKEVAKEYRKRCGGQTMEMILVGGASVLVNYGFRESTYDIDAEYLSDSALKEAINLVGDRFGLPAGWLNTDFKKTASYSPLIRECSAYYKTFSGVLEIRTIRAEYLVAMKLVSGRRYKKDLSDVVGILYEQQRAGNPLNAQMIDTAVKRLYGGWDRVDPFAKELLEKALNHPDLEALFLEQSEDETVARAALTEIDQKYPRAVREDNADEIIALALKKNDEKKKASSSED